VKSIEKKILLSILSIILITSKSSAIICMGECPSSTCDATLIYAMKLKQKKSISDRLDNFIGIIKANIRQTKNQTKIIKKEILAYSRLLERIQKEALMLKEANHISQQIRESTILGESIKIIQKGKK